MKKIFAILSILGTIFYAFAVCAAENPLLSPDWWKTATPEMVENAIRNGADVKVKNAEGKTALDYAKDNPHIYRTKVYWLLNDRMYE